MGVGTIVAAILRLRGSGGVPPRQGKWRQLSGPIFAEVATVAVIGCGVVGKRVARQLAASGLVDRLVLGVHRPQRLHGFVRQLLDVDVEVISPGPLPQSDITVLTQPSGGHAELAEEAISNGSHVVSVSEAIADVEALLDLDAVAPRLSER